MMIEKVKVELLVCFLVMLSSYASGTQCKRNGLYEHPTDCTKFYSCAAFGPVLMDCPDGLHFHRKLLVCVWPDQSDCIPEPTGSTEPELDHHEGSCPIYSHPTEESKYYVCYPEGPKLFQCPEGLRFNPELLTCDFPENGGCSPNFTHVEEITTSSEQLTTWRNQLVTETTSEKISTLPTTTDAGTTWIPESSTTTFITTTSLVDSCAIKIWPHPSNCKQFFMSGPLGPLELACPGGLLFNPELSTCDVAANVICSSGLETTTQATEEVTDAYSMPCKESIWPHPTNLKKFFKCSSTGPVEVSCPEGLLFNRLLLVCDWPQNCENFSNASTQESTTVIMNQGSEDSTTQKSTISTKRPNKCNLKKHRK